jgi:cyclic-di-GMP-binding protein
MADAKRAREIIDGLPTDATRALLEVTELLESLNQTEGFRLNRRFENIGLLEAAVREHQRTLLRDYLFNPRQQRYYENQLWNCATGFGKQLEAAYALCVRQYDSGFAGITSIGVSLPVIMARAVRALTFQLKWGLFRYGPVEPRIWGAIAGLYRLAEQRGVADGVILVYPGEPARSSVQREFLRAVMLAASSPDGLLPLHQEIAARVIAHLVGAFRVSTTPEGCTHCFDLALTKPPLRLFHEVQPTETLRYFGPGEALAGLEQLAAQISSGGIPADFHLAGSYEPELVAAVLGRLAHTWSLAPSVRGTERRQTAGRATVVPGLKELLSTLKPPGGDDLDLAQPKSAESWIVDNMSDDGYGAIIPPKTSEWVRVGALVGLKSDTSQDWAVGLIRRITIDEHKQRRVGIELLTKAAASLALSMADSMTSLDFNLSTEPGILLAAAPDAEGEVGVLLCTGVLNGVFKERDKLELKSRDQTLLVRLAKIIEAGEGFDWAKMKVVPA